MKFFLKLKHWQLFLLAIAIPFGVYIGAFLYAIGSGNPFLIFRFFPLIMLLFMFGQYGWMFSTARLLNPKVSEVRTLKLGRFYFFFFFPVIYLLLLMGSLSWFFSQVALDGNFNPDLDADPLFLFAMLFFPVHLFAMFCLFYCQYFVAKTIKSVELKREAVLNDYIGEFFLIWFFAVGLWIIQPKLNQFADED